MKAGNFFAGIKLNPQQIIFLLICLNLFLFIFCIVKFKQNKFDLCCF